MCWLTPKSLEGSSSKPEIERFGFTSQSPGSESLEEVENDEAEEEDGKRRSRSECEFKFPDSPGRVPGVETALVEVIKGESDENNRRELGTRAHRENDG